MALKTTSLFIVLLFLFPSCQSIEFEVSDRITIYRDQWGVPHIHAPTDAEVAYGLAWAECEDDFKTIQEQMLAIKGRLGELKGKSGIIADFAIHFMQVRKNAQIGVQTELDNRTKKLLDHFAEGINTYAAYHKEKVHFQDLFPLESADILAGYLLGLVEISSASKDLEKIMSGEIIHDMKSNFPKGSNAIAFSKNITESEETFLAINSHQPLEGWYSWYEAHLISDEGLNILGGTFPGGATIFHGVNEYLGWAHTVNHADFSDVYKLEMHPDKSLQYNIDGQWLELQKEEIWAWMHLWHGIKLPIRRTIYHSIYGPTFKNQNNFYSWAMIASQSSKALNQWYAMNKAKNFEEFKEALIIQGIPCTNIIYADNEDNIYYISNGKLPKRSNNIRWQEVILGLSKETLWQEYYTIEELPQVLNPNSGYVYNTNNTPFSSTDSLSNPDESLFSETMGFQTKRMENNRSERIKEFMEIEEKFSYEEFKELKYDRHYPQIMKHRDILNLELLMDLDTLDFPEIKEEIIALRNWNRSTLQSDTTALLFFESYDELVELLKENNNYKRGNSVTSKECALAIQRAKENLLVDYGICMIPLGEVQRHIRGNINLPIDGGPDVLAAIYTKDLDNGQKKAIAGESYILLATFNKNKAPRLESIHAYGSSANPKSPHYTDQMEMFVNQKLKPMYLSLDSVKSNARKVYSPMRIKS